MCTTDNENVGLYPMIPTPVGPDPEPSGRRASRKGPWRSLWLDTWSCWTGSAAQSEVTNEAGRNTIVQNSTGW